MKKFKENIKILLIKDKFHEGKEGFLCYIRGYPKSIFLVIPAAAKRNAGISYN
jgi:hypothetical protein